jgi:hypothetical protein
MEDMPCKIRVAEGYRSDVVHGLDERITLALLSSSVTSMKGQEVWRITSRALEGGGVKSIWSYWTRGFLTQRLVRAWLSR